MRKRYYIFIVTHDWDGQLRRIPIPVQYVVLFVAFAVIGVGTLMGLAGSYSRMLTKVQNFNELRSRQELLLTQLTHARQDAEQFRAEVASLGTLASEVSSLYNFKHNASLKQRLKAAAGGADDFSDGLDTARPDGLSLYADTLNNFQVLETTALANSLPQRQVAIFGPGVWQPDLWPVRGRITSSFGQRQDPITGENGANHTGIDIAAGYGTPVHVSADGVVVFAGIGNGYGRMVEVDHGHGLMTLYGHLSALSVTVGQRLERDDVLGFVGDSGRATGPHLHYEVRIGQAPVNPYRYLHP